MAKTTKIAGIDVSRWNAALDYKKLAKATVDGYRIRFAMLRFSYGCGKDTLFDKHYENFKAVGINVGVYHWMLAQNVEQAKQEAAWLAKQLKGYELEYPVALDFEDTELLALNLSKDEYTAIVDAFMKVLKDNGYYVILYANPSCLEQRLNTSVRTDYDLWLAHWVDTPRKYGQKIWQYGALGTASEVKQSYATAEGYVDGANGPIDVNWGYFNYPSKIKELGLNNFAKKYVITGTKTVTAKQLAQTEGPLKAMGFTVKRTKLK